MVPEQGIHGHHHPGGAESTLGAVALGDSLLEGVHLWSQPRVPGVASHLQGPQLVSFWANVPRLCLFLYTPFSGIPKALTQKPHLIILIDFQGQIL